MLKSFRAASQLVRRYVRLLSLAKEWLCQHLGLGPSHLAGGSRRVFRGPPTQHVPNRGVNRGPFSVIGIFVGRQPAEEGLPHQGDHRVLRVLARPPITQQIINQISEAQRRVQFPIGQQPGIRRDLGT
jgi:hypothetical protein